MFPGFKDLFGFHSLKAYPKLPGLKLQDSLLIELLTSYDNFEGKELLLILFLNLRIVFTKFIEILFMDKNQILFMLTGAGKILNTVSLLLLFSLFLFHLFPGDGPMRALNVFKDHSSAKSLSRFIINFLHFLFPQIVQVS